jgi:hypothetical protein
VHCLQECLIGGQVHSACVEHTWSTNKLLLVTRTKQIFLALFNFSSLNIKTFDDKYRWKCNALWRLKTTSTRYYLNGNAEVIQTAVKDYFIIQQGSYELHSDLSPKRSGIKTGLLVISTMELKLFATLSRRTYTDPHSQR